MVLVVEFLFLLLLANATPVLARELLQHRFDRPLDGGLRFIDGEPLLGPSKTARGVLLSIPVTALGAHLLGLDWHIGALAAALSMAGDLLSSFIKRRMKVPSSGSVPGLDQIPESLFPALACQSALHFDSVDIVLIVSVFLIGNLAVNRAGRQALGR